MLLNTLKNIQSYLRDHAGEHDTKVRLELYADSSWSLTFYDYDSMEREIIFDCYMKAEEIKDPVISNLFVILSNQILAV